MADGHEQVGPQGDLRLAGTVDERLQVLRKLLDKGHHSRQQWVWNERKVLYNLLQNFLSFTTMSKLLILKTRGPKGP